MDGPGPGPKPPAAAGLGPCVPGDAIVEIFKLLPARSLHRFKCVSKAWSAMVTEPLHRHQFAQTLAGFLNLHAAQIGAADCDRCRDAGESSLRTCRHVLRCARSFINVSGMADPLLDPAFSFLPPTPAPPGGEAHRDVILDARDGLILLGRFRRDETPGVGLPICYLVCNPTIAPTAVVPDSGEAPIIFHELVRTYLLFDAASSPDQFHLLQFWEQLGTVRGLLTYSSAEGRWTNRMLELWLGAGWEVWGRGYGMAVIQQDTGSAVVNGMLHLVVDTDGDGTNSLVAVDEVGRAARTLQLPRAPEERDWHSVFVGRSQGRLHYIMCARPRYGQLSPEDPSKLLIWVLQNYATGEWALRDTVSFPELFGRVACQFRTEYTVVAVHPDGNWVFFVRHWDRKLVAYDMDRGDVLVIGDLGPDGDQCWDELPTPYNPLYSESAALVSSE